jgi:hypothetical protein
MMEGNGERLNNGLFFTITQYTYTGSALEQ